MAHESSVSVTLRPGVAWPIWPLVTDPTARRALEAGLAASRWLEKWAGLEDREDRLWQAILRGFARSGGAQDIGALGRSLDLAASTVAELLAGLRRRDMVVLDETGASVSAAYPFCAWPTEHRLSAAGGKRLSSLCAIDALGAGAMLGQGTLVDSACRACAAPIRIATREQGHALASVTPETAVVWYGVHDTGGCSATSSCTLKAFFCTSEHLASWRTADGRGGTGFALSPEAALQIGRAIFQPLLAPGKSSH